MCGCRSPLRRACPPPPHTKKAFDLKWYKAIRRTSGGLTLPSLLTVKVWSHTSPFYRCLPWSLSFLTKSSLPHLEHALIRDLSPVSPLPR
jgi:hypothetical protein